MIPMLSLVADATTDANNSNPLWIPVFFVGLIAAVLGFGWLSQRIKANTPPPAVHCPSCGKNNARRVHTHERVTSGVAGGLLFSKKARAQFQCLACKYYW